jgi:hypothetical protein
VSIEKMCIDTIDVNINMTVPWYLMASYAYYVEDNPILSDEYFDRISQKMIKNWGDIEHMHKHLITLDMLGAGSYLGEYPSMVKGALEEIRKSNSD